MKVVIEAHKLENLIGPLVRQAPFIAMKAINDTLFDARQDQVNRQMKLHIAGGPVPWTKKALRYDKAKKNFLQGSLYFSGNRPYLKTIMKGGVVKPKKERLVAPVLGKIRLTKQGNLTQNKIKTLKNNPRYFVGLPKRTSTPADYGLYRIKGRKKSARLERVAYINLRQRRQRPTYEADKLAVRYISRRIKRNIIRATAHAIRTSR